MKILPIVAVVLAVAAGIFLYMRTKRVPPVTPPPQETAPEEVGVSTTTPEGLVIRDVKVGEGDEVTSGKMVEVHYTGVFADGAPFDSSRLRGKPFRFTLGAGEVIEGWDKGVLGMRVGGVRRLEIPPALAYGESGVSGAIPPNATLLFEIELLSFD